MPPSTCLMEDSIEGCTNRMPSICELPQGSAPGKYGPCPIQTTSPEWSVPCTPARTRRSTIYHSIYINSLINSSVVPSFLIRSPCFSSPRLLPWLPIGSVLSVSQSPEPQRLHLVPEAPRDRKKLPVVPNYPFRSIRPPRLNRPFPLLPLLSSSLLSNASRSSSRASNAGH